MVASFKIKLDFQIRVPTSNSITMQQWWSICSLNVVHLSKHGFWLGWPQGQCYQLSRRRVFNSTSDSQLSPGLRHSIKLLFHRQMKSTWAVCFGLMALKGQDFYYGLAPYQTLACHLSITWLTPYPSDQVFWDELYMTSTHTRAPCVCWSLSSLLAKLYTCSTRLKVVKVVYLNVYILSPSTSVYLFYKYIR